MQMGAGLLARTKNSTEKGSIGRTTKMEFSVTRGCFLTVCTFSLIILSTRGNTHGTLLAGEMVVQIVTFSRARTPGLRPQWHQQLRNPEDVRKALLAEIPEDSWRWVHCEGLHGPTLRAVAEGTGKWRSSFQIYEQVLKLLL